MRLVRQRLGYARSRRRNGLPPTGFSTRRRSVSQADAHVIVALAFQQHALSQPKGLGSGPNFVNPLLRPLPGSHSRRSIRGQSLFARLISAATLVSQVPPASVLRFHNEQNVAEPVKSACSVGLGTDARHPRRRLGSSKRNAPIGIFYSPMAGVSSSGCNSLQGACQPQCE